MHLSRPVSFPVDISVSLAPLEQRRATHEVCLGLGFTLAASLEPKYSEGHTNSISYILTILQ